MVKKTKDVKYYKAIGRRKEAVANVRLYITSRDKTLTIGGMKTKQGDFFINKKTLSDFFPSLVEQNIILKPFKLTDNINRFTTFIYVEGGGKQGQLKAIVHGISRAIADVDREQYRGILKEEGLLTRDPRVRERRKVGTGGKARRRKQSPKR